MGFFWRTLFLLSLVNFSIAVILSTRKNKNPRPSNIYQSTDAHTSLQGFPGLAWYYERPQGPDTWPRTYPGCAGFRQSPIALRVREAITSPHVAPLELFGYRSRDLTMEAVNNGVVVKFNVFANTPITKPARMMNGAATPADSYELAEIHLHWGRSAFEGSEHSLEGRLFPAEIHFVHKLTRLTLAQAVNTPKGLAVLGSFFTVGQEENMAYKPLISALERIKYKNTSATFRFDKKLRNLLPADVNQFFRYDGSLTTPTCNEVVIWTVFRNPIWISETQMNAFRSVMRTYANDPSPAPLLDNFRPVQHTNGRPVYKHGIQDFY